MKKTRKVILILGKPGSGKTELTKKLIRQWSRVVVFDTLGEYHGGFIVRNFEEFVSATRKASADIRRSVEVRETFLIICRYETTADFESTLEAVWELENCLLVVEEAWGYFNESNPDSPFLRIVFMGRHRELSLICNAQRTMMMNIRIRSVFTSIVTFKQTEERDIAALEDYGFERSQIEALDESKYQNAVIGQTFTFDDKGGVTWYDERGVEM